MIYGVFKNDNIMVFEMEWILVLLKMIMIWTLMRGDMGLWGIEMEVK